MNINSSSKIKIKVKKESIIRKTGSIIGSTVCSVKSNGVVIWLRTGYDFMKE